MQHLGPLVPSGRIGSGSRGVVFEEPRTDMVYKLAKAPSDLLWNDYGMHQRVVEAFNRAKNANDLDLTIEISVPAVFYFVNSDDAGSNKW